MRTGRRHRAVGERKPGGSAPGRGSGEDQSTLRSLLDLELPTLAEAEHQLDELVSKRRAWLGWGVGLAACAATAALLLPGAAVALTAGSAVALIGAAAAVDRRRTLLGNLLRVREAYSLDQVRAAGSRFASLARRRRLAAWVRRIVMSAEGEERRMGYNAASLDDRVLSRRDRFLALADALECPDRPVHPASVAIVHRLLTRPPSSPLYNPGIDEDILDLVLHRVEAGIDI